VSTDLLLAALLRWRTKTDQTLTRCRAARQPDNRSARTPGAPGTRHAADGRAVQATKPSHMIRRGRRRRQRAAEIPGIAGLEGGAASGNRTPDLRITNAPDTSTPLLTQSTSALLHRHLGTPCTPSAPGACSSGHEPGHAAPVACVFCVDGPCQRVQYVNLDRDACCSATVPTVRTASTGSGPAEITSNAAGSFPAAYLDRYDPPPT
jgi:hypothetical protein